MREALVEINGQYLLEHLKRNNISNIEFARALGVNVKTIQRWIHGHIKRVTPSTVERILAAVPCERDGLVVPESETNLVSQNQTLGAMLNLRFIKSLKGSDQLQALYKVLKTFVLRDLPTRQFAELYGVLGYIHLKVGSLRAARFYLSASVKAFRRSKDEKGIVWALYYLSVVQEYSGQFDDAQKCLEMINSYSCPEELEISGTYRRGRIAQQQNRPLCAESFYRKAIQQAHEGCIEVDVLYKSYYRLGWLEMQKGSMESAAVFFLRSIVVSTKLGDEFAKLIGHKSYLVACTLIGRSPAIERSDRLFASAGKIPRSKSQKEILDQIDFYLAIAQKKFGEAQVILEKRRKRVVRSQSNRRSLEVDEDLLAESILSLDTNEPLRGYLKAI